MKMLKAAMLALGLLWLTALVSSHRWRTPS